MPFDKDFADQRKFLPEVIDILGAKLARRTWIEAPPPDDMERNTDLLVLQQQNDATRCAVRLRTYSYWPKYPDEFTIRSDRPEGGKTELRKIVQGWGTYNFYGFRSEDDSTIHAWMIGDLNVFRSWHSDQLLRTHKIPGLEQANGDGSSKFRAYRLDDLPGGFVLARHRPALDDELPF